MSSRTVVRRRRVSKDRRTQEGHVYRTGYNQGHFDASKKMVMAIIGSAVGAGIASGLKVETVVDELIDFLEDCRRDPSILQGVIAAVEAEVQKPTPRRGVQ